MDQCAVQSNSARIAPWCSRDWRGSIAEAAARYGAGQSFVTISHEQQTAICDDICLVEKAKPRFVKAAKFFARYRDLTAGGFYTTPQGRQDVRYVGNVPLPHFDGPPPEVLQKVGLA